jgi:hypothetical protein
VQSHWNDYRWCDCRLDDLFVLTAIATIPVVADRVGRIARRVEVSSWRHCCTCPPRRVPATLRHCSAPCMCGRICPSAPQAHREPLVHSVHHGCGWQKACREASHCHHNFLYLKFFSTTLQFKVLKNKIIVSLGVLEMQWDPTALYYIFALDNKYASDI